MKKKLISILIFISMTFLPVPGRCDMFGADVGVLIQILQESIKQYIALQQIFSTGMDTLNLMRDINSGIRNGLSVIKIINPNFNPGVFGNIQSPNQVLNIIQDLYEQVPETSAAKLQQSQDQSVADSLSMHGALYDYANQVDLESKTILDRVNDSSPQGTAKLQAQSLGILIGVTTQVLRTNSAMLKMLAQNMALANRKDKIQSQQFKQKYDDLSNAFKENPKSDLTKVSP